ncbi:hypothetical protein BG006_000269 [Podila minutissima]|uniref:Uncharacterized protein n=1 Tax=Podila minutissima TaxID=64525 RepID=A0A9P5SDS7_9FUNG|nr:hypothetical protein BG006_000269 [Podila minutissima]
MLFPKALISTLAALAITSTSISASPTAHLDSSSSLDKRAFGGHDPRPRGHSEGSTLPRVYFKYNNGGAKTRKFAGIGSNSYGSTLASLTTLMESLGLHNEVEGVLNSLCKACFQLIVGAPLSEELNTPNDTVPGLQPYQNGWLKDKNPNVKNQQVQDWCAADLVGHIAQATDRKSLMRVSIIFNGIRNFFSNNGKTASCLSVVT